jgi:hypothetical protein
MKDAARGFIDVCLEMTCAILESCGRFLFRSAETHRRTKIYLEQMLRSVPVAAVVTCEQNPLIFYLSISYHCHCIVFQLPTGIFQHTCYAHFFMRESLLGTPRCVFYPKF